MAGKKRKLSFKKMLQKDVKKVKRTIEKEGEKKAKGVKKKEREVRARIDKKEVEKERIKQLIRSKDVSRIIPEERSGIEDIKKIEEVMGFEVNGEFYCVPLNYVSEIVALEPIPAPDLPPYIIGISEYRGDVLPVIDPGLMFGIGQVQAEGSSCLILNLDGTSVAMKVTRIHGIIKLKGKKIYDLPDGLQMDYLKGALEYNGRVMAILDPIKLLQSENIQDIWSKS